MRSLKLILLSTLFVMPAFAADPGTYRPGMAYDSVPSNTSDICEAQCSGDAQCRGWNFVKVNPSQNMGICEFNAKDAAPVPSPYSISGNNVSSVHSAKIIPGRSNTVRVGNIAGSMAKPSPKRRIVREPVPQRVQTKAATYKRSPMQRNTAPSSQAPSVQNLQNMSLTQQQNLQRQRQRPSHPSSQHYSSRQQGPATPRHRFQHTLDDARSNPQNPQAMRQPHAPSQSKFEGDPRLQQRLRQQRQMEQQKRSGQNPAMTAPQAQMPQRARGPQRQRRDGTRPQTQTSYTQGRLSAPPNVPPMIAPQMNTAPAMRAPASQARQNMRRPAVNIPAEMAPQMNAAQAQASLFGSLNDDVKIPRPINPAQFAANPDAPIPTVTSVPVAPVQMGPMPAPESGGGLAGGL